MGRWGPDRGSVSSSSKSGKKRRKRRSTINVVDILYHDESGQDPPTSAAVGGDVPQMINMSSKSTTGLNTANTDGPYSASNVKGNLQLFSAAKASSDGVQVGSVAERLNSASVVVAADGDDRLTQSEKAEKRIPVKDGPEGPGVALRRLWRRMMLQNFHRSRR